MSRSSSYCSADCSMGPLRPFIGWGYPLTCVPLLFWGECPICTDCDVINGITYVINQWGVQFFAGPSSIEFALMVMMTKDCVYDQINHTLWLEYVIESRLS